MSNDQFCEAMLGLHDRAACLRGARAHRLRDIIADSISHAAPGVDERLAQVHRQLTLVEIAHRLTQAECQATMSIG